MRLDNRDVPREPDVVDSPALRQQHAGKTCPICTGLGRLKCSVVCEEGQTTLLGGKQECTRCKGAGLLVCEVCHGQGFVAKE